MYAKHANEAIKARGTNNLPQRITDESNGLTYTLHGDYYFTDIEIPKADRQPIGMWGIRRMEYLKRYRMSYYTRLILSGELCDHLRKVDEQARFRMETLMAGYKRSWGIAEELKAADQMQWVGLMNNARMEAERNVVEEIICE